MYYSMRQGTSNNSFDNILQSTKQIAATAWLPTLVAGIMAFLIALVLIAMQQSTPNVPGFVPPNSSAAADKDTRELSVTSSSGGSISSTSSANDAQKAPAAQPSATTNQPSTTPKTSASDVAQPANNGSSGLVDSVDTSPVIGGRGADTSTTPQSPSQSQQQPAISEPLAPIIDESSNDKPAGETATDSGLDVGLSVDTPITDPVTLDAGTDSGLQLDVGL